MFTTVGKAATDIATGWAASLGLTIPTWKKGDEIPVERLPDGTYRSTEKPDVLLAADLLDFDL